MNNYLSILVVAVISIGCQTRSISNSDYGGTWGYRGELSELEVLGVNANKKISEEDIKAALNKQAFTPMPPDQQQQQQADTSEGETGGESEADSQQHEAAQQQAGLGEDPGQLLQEVRDREAKRRRDRADRQSGYETVEKDW